MEQLITRLEAKINWLSEQLDNANEEIKKLKGENHPPIEHSASMDLLQHMTDSSTEDRVQNYIKDALDLLDTDTPSEPIEKARPVEYQLNFDLFHEHAATSSTTTTIEQTDHMTTTQQSELSGLQEENLVNDTSASEASDSITTETATLTPEQKKRQKNQKNNRRLIKLLEDRYPKAFDWNQPKPLKVGIDKDMTLDDDFNTSKQKRALAAYTRSDRYKKCLLSGQPRIDLEGVAVNNEPALPESMMPVKTKSTAPKTRTTSRPDREKPARSAKSKPTPQPKTKTNQKPQNTPRQDDAYDNLSPEERMKAKLAKLLNKS